MIFEEILLSKSKSKQAKLAKHAAKAAKDPDTGIKIVKKAAYFVIRDCANIAQQYLPHYIYTQYDNPFKDLQDAFTSDQVADLINRAERNLVTRQLLDIILTDIRDAFPSSTPVKKEEEKFDVTDLNDDDIYGDYDMYDNDEDEELETVLEDHEIDEHALIIKAFKITK